MFLSRVLHKRHPNYFDYMTRFWQLDGPRGPSQIKRMNRTRRIDPPVTEEQVADMREKMENEFQVMRCLATPYLTKEQEGIWHRNHGHPDELLEKAKEEFEQMRMPGKAKAVSGVPKKDKLRGNVGNLLHRHRTVEDDLGYLLNERRFDG